MTKFIAKSAIIATLYIVLTVAISPLSYGAVQLRISECLTVLAIFYPEAVVGLTVGCFFSNLIGGGVLDMVFGTLATLLSSLFTYLLAKKIKKFGINLSICLFLNVFINAILVPLCFTAYSPNVKTYFTAMLTVGLGQLAVLSTLGIILAVAFNKLKSKRKIDFI